jgi:hypothetical protein
LKGDEKNELGRGEFERKIRLELDRLLEHQLLVVADGRRRDSPLPPPPQGTRNSSSSQTPTTTTLFNRKLFFAATCLTSIGLFVFFATIFGAFFIH